MAQLIKEFTLGADFGAVHDVGVGPFGDRVIIAVRGGRFRGDRLNGSIVEASGDWLLQGADEYGRIDARFTLRTTDGATIFMQFFGLVENTAPVRALSDNGIPTRYGDLYFFTNPRLETGHERYAWVNRTMPVTPRLRVGDGGDAVAQARPRRRRCGWRTPPHPPRGRTNLSRPRTHAIRRASRYLV